MTRLFVLLIVVLLPSSALAQSSVQDRVFVSSLFAVGVMQGADIASTIASMRHGQAREINPLLSPIVQQPFVLTTVKVSAAVATALVLERLYRSKPKTAIAIAFVQAGLVGYVAHRNGRFGSPR